MTNELWHKYVMLVIGLRNKEMWVGCVWPIEATALLCSDTLYSVKFTASKYVGGVDKYIITKEIKKEIASMEYSKRSLKLTKKILNTVCSKHLSTCKPGQVKING